MKDNKSSSTAWGVAMARAAHVKYDPPPHVFDDSLALELIDPDIQKMVSMFAPSDRVPKDVYRNRPYLAFRQRYQEECLLKAYEEGARQFIILGAGVDSYAFRQQVRLADLTIFEVDFPATQKEKQQRIASLGWQSPQNLVFAPCDFECDNLANALTKVGFDSTVPSYFAWMGVTIYLEPNTVFETLKKVRSLCAAGSIAFEYAPPYEELSGGDKACRDYSLAQENRKTEPFLSYFSLPEINSKLLELGYTRIEPLDHDQAACEIESQRSDDLSIYHGFRLIRAAW